MFVEFWYISNRRQLHHLFLHTHIHYSIALYAHTPPITPLRSSEIDGIASHFLTHKHAISQVDRIATYTPLDEARSIVALHDGHRAHAVAALEDKAHHTEDKHQVH